MNILLIDDDEDEFILLREIFTAREALRGVHLKWVGTYEEAQAALGDPAYDVFLLDYRLGERSGLDLLRQAAATGCRAPIIVLTGQGDDEVDLAAMQLGAANYLAKDQISLPLLEHSIRYALEQKRARNELEQRRDELDRLQAATATLLKTLDLEALLCQILDAARNVVPAAESSWLYLADVDSYLSREHPALAGSREHPAPAGSRELPGPQGTSGLRDSAGAESLDSIDAECLHADSPHDERIRQLKLERHATNLGLEGLPAGGCVLIADAARGAPLEAFGCQLAAPGEARSALVALLAGSAQDEPPAALVLGASQPAAFSEADRRLLATFAATATLALKNGVLHRREHTHAITDPLTGQLNRRQFLALGQREMERYHRYGRELGLIMFDIDHLKEVNDALGHAAGDQVICAVADRCRRALRQVDILGRLGGDEFAVILPELEPDAEQVIAERIRRVISDLPIAAGAGPVSVTVSLGVGRVSRAAGDLNMLLNLADKAPYRAKNDGRNQLEVAGDNS